MKQAYHSVRFPVFCTSWYIGLPPGITVGIGATDDDDVGRRGVVVVAMLVSIGVRDMLIQREMDSVVKRWELTGDALL